jgi:hypothetical protein
METQRRRTKPETEANAHESEANVTSKKSQKDTASSRDVTIRKRSPSSNAIISPVCVKLHVGISPGIFLLFCMTVQRWLFVVTRYLTYTFGPISIAFIQPLLDDTSRTLRQFSGQKSQLERWPNFPRGGPRMLELRNVF